MMSNAWGFESANNPASRPYAGSKQKIVNVNSREAYRNDHHRNLFVAGTKDLPPDHMDDLKLPLVDTLHLTKRGRDVEAYYKTTYA